MFTGGKSVLLVADPFDGVQFKNAGASGGRCRS